MFARVLLLCAVVIWGWTFVATKILVAELGPIEVFALRLAIGLPFLGGVLLAARVPLVFTRADLGALLLGGAVLTLHFLVQIAGLVTTTATNGGWIICVSPLVLALLSFLFLRERIRWTGVAGIAVATLGILLLARPAPSPAGGHQVRITKTMTTAAAVSSLLANPANACTGITITRTILFGGRFVGAASSSTDR